MAKQAETTPESKSSSVIILSAINQPGTQTAVVKACIDLTRPADIARDFARELRQCKTVALPARAQNPKLYKALELKQRADLSFREASERIFGTPNKAPALCRLLNAGLNAGGGGAKHQGPPTVSR